MGRFYFHVRVGNKLVADEEGQDFPDVFAARREAIRSARELLADAIKSGRARVPEAFVITDKTGALDTVALAAVLREPLRKTLKGNS